jgi:pimeloyl-ACP methyl ester carboxylesterase
MPVPPADGRARLAGRAAAAALAALALAVPGGAAAGPRRLALAPCSLAHPVEPDRVAAECGTLEVPEDRSRPEGRRLALRVAVAHADAATPKPDPVVLLAGGPGQAAAELYPAVDLPFRRIARGRDVVLVDQRGTGGSARLSCPELPEPSRGRELPDAERVALAAACARALSAGADLARYGTLDFVADLEAVREALGYESWNLVGFSYGTRVALAYARAHPSRVRTMILDGVAPPQMRVGAEFAEDGEAALRAALRRCAEDRLCAEKNPALEADLEAALARLARPVEVELRDPRTGEPRVEELGRDHLTRVLFALSYAPEGAALYPPAIRAAARGDLAPLGALVSLLAGDVEATIARPLQLSVVCAEDVPFYPPPAAGAARGVYGRDAEEAFRKLCAVWPVPPAPAAVKEPVRADVPALLLSGEADPVTPARWGALAAETLPRGRHVVLPGMGHGVLFRGCLPRVAKAFLDAGSADGLDLACAARIRPPPPFVDLQGGAP